MKKFQTLALMLAAAFACESFAQASTYSDIESMMAVAMSKGRVEGVLVGPIDEAFTRQFKSTGRLYVKIKEVEKLPLPGCSRLQVNYTKYDVPTPKGKTEYLLTADLSYCKDGAPPLGETVSVPAPERRK